VCIERIFPLHSPRVDKIEVLKQGKVRKAKLFYLRKLSGKAARLSERNQPEEHAAAAAKPAPAPAPKAEKPAAAAPAPKAETAPAAK